MCFTRLRHMIINEAAKGMKIIAGKIVVTQGINKAWKNRRQPKGKTKQRNRR